MAINAHGGSISESAANNIDDTRKTHNTIQSAIFIIAFMAISFFLICVNDHLGLCAILELRFLAWFCFRPPFLDARLVCSQVVFLTALMRVCGVRFASLESLLFSFFLHVLIYLNNGIILTITQSAIHIIPISSLKCSSTPIGNSMRKKNNKNLQRRKNRYHGNRQCRCVIRRRRLQRAKN